MYTKWEISVPAVFCLCEKYREDCDVQAFLMFGVDLDHWDWDDVLGCVTRHSLDLSWLKVEV